MKKTLFKDFLRALGRNPARFLSILFIIALGVGFFAGINATRPDMEKSAWKYYKDTNLMDLRSYNPLGYKEGDFNKLSTVEGIEGIQKVFRKDLFLINGGENVVLRLFSMNGKTNSNSEPMNKPVVTEGRLPEKPGEIALNKGKYIKSKVELNTKITLAPPEGEKLEDYLKTVEYTVVGFIESPLYISYLRDRTNIGNGVIESYGYVLEEDFSEDKYHEIFLKVKGADVLNPKDEEYKNLVSKVKEKVDVIGKESLKVETEDIRKKLEDGKKELSDNKQKAEDELSSGINKINEGRFKLDNSKADLLRMKEDGEKSLEEGREKLQESRQELIDGWSEYNEGFSEWNKGNQEYLKGKSKLDLGKAELDSAKIQITSGKAQLDSSYNQLMSAKTQLDTFADALNTVIELRNSMPNPLALSDLQTIVDEINAYYPEAAQYLAQLDVNDPLTPTLVASQLDTAINYFTSMYNSQLELYNNGLAQYNQGLADYEAGVSEYESGLAEYEAGKAELDDAKTKVDDGKAELDKAKKDLEDGDLKIKQGDLDIEKGEKKLKKGLEVGEKELTKGFEEYEEGLRTYNIEKEDALKKIAEADDKILKSERDLKEVPDKWLVYNRDGNPDYTSYFDNAVKIGNVAKIFPMFFFLVAALVSLTTITRMVDEERQMAGTLKALGYSRGSISAKYISYSFLASIFGSILGLFAGFNIFPRVIMNAYNMLYSVPVSVVEFNPILALISIGFAVASTVLAALAALGTSIKETPAQLMMPKAPPPGKRIFLERLTFLWKRLSFSQKVTMRNLFLYKKRLLMTILGIAGCTALIVTGFGIKDSVEAMVKNQFKELSIYDEVLVLDLKKDQAQRDLNKILNENPQINEMGQFISDTLKVKVPNSDRTYDANLVVPEDSENIGKFQILRNSNTKEIIPLKDDGAVISEKLAETLRVNIGDSVTYLDGDNNEFSVKIIGISENYLENFLYMSSKTYTDVHLLKPEYNSAWVNLKEDAAANEDKINEKIMGNKGVITILSARELSKTFEEQVASLIIVVLVLIISAGLLAFVVLYNLNNVNITERKRELATIKVLGFRDKEVSAYIYRENMILTLLGSLTGLGLGVVLHKFIMKTMEMDNMMFGKDILLPSFLYSIVITFVFSIFVNFIMHISLKKIDMVESLKSVE